MRTFLERTSKLPYRPCVTYLTTRFGYYSLRRASTGLTAPARQAGTTVAITAASKGRAFVFCGKIVANGGFEIHCDRA